MRSLDALLAFAVSGGIAFVLTPFVGRAARTIGAMDLPRTRSLHELPTPRLGGVAIFAGVIVAGAILLPHNKQYVGILVGAALILVVGVADDIWNLHPAPKLAGQVAAAIVPVACGVRVESITVPPGLGVIDLGGLSGPLTVVGIVAVMNAVNFIDGVDGLAAGVCTISAAAFAVVALSLDRGSAGVLAALIAGASFGFLFHNFHPASVFMGDSGSNLLGYLMGTVAVQGALKTAAAVAFVFPLVILAVPILDSSFVIAKRIKYREPIYQADTWHLHHRFAAIGFSQRKTVLYLYAWTLVLSSLALALRFVPYSDGHGHFKLWGSVALAAIFLVALAASIYLVYVLEILKLKRFRFGQIKRERQRLGQSAPRESEVEAAVAHELETGEFQIVRIDDPT